MIFMKDQHFFDALNTKTLPQRLKNGGTRVFVSSEVKVKALYQNMVDSYDCVYHTLDGKSGNKPQNLLTNFDDLSKFCICTYSILVCLVYTIKHPLSNTYTVNKQFAYMHLTTDIQEEISLLFHGDIDTLSKSVCDSLVSELLNNYSVVEITVNEVTMKSFCMKNTQHVILLKGEYQSSKRFETHDVFKVRSI